MASENTTQPIILIVDDRLQSLKPLIAFLEKFGFRIAVAKNGEEALKQMEYALPDLILLDVLMPGIDGFETCRCLKERETVRDIPVIFMTAASDMVEKMKGFNAGGVDYLTKPVHFEEVLARINAHLGIRRLQQELQTRNAFLEHLLESLTNPFYVIDISDYTVILAISAANHQDIPDNITCYELFHHRNTPCDQAGSSCSITAVKNSGKPVTLEHTHFDQYGTAKHVEVHAYPIFDQHHNVVQIIEYSLDITERKRIEEELARNHKDLYDLVQKRTVELTRSNEQLHRKIAERKQIEIVLKESEKRYRTLYEEAPTAYFSIDTDMTIKQCNLAASTLLGYTREELLRMRVFDLYSDGPEGIPKARTLFHRFLAGKSIRDEELQMKTQDGTPVWISLTVHPVKNWQGQVVESRSTVINITKRKLQEIVIKEERNHLKRENIALRTTLQDRYKFGEIIGKSPVMQQVYELIIKAAASGASVVIQGETGVGKELAARTIHQLSKRRKDAFVVVNCGAVTASLFEREFFGHRKGAFTGADRDKQGYFDQAHQGTLFLDELGELSPTEQVTLLRAIDIGEYIPVGDSTNKKADMRIIAATNRNLEEMYQQGLLREDFYYRINVIAIMVPPLRERREDIPLLIDHFLEKYHAGTPRPVIPGRLMEQFVAYDWPGNVRELQNKIQRYLAIGQPDLPATFDAASIEIPSLPVSGDTSGMPDNLGLYVVLDQLEKQMILHALKHNKGKKQDTAAMLRIGRRTLYKKMKKYGIERSQYKNE